MLKITILGKINVQFLKNLKEVFDIVYLLIVSLSFSAFIFYKYKELNKKITDKENLITNKLLEQFQELNQIKTKKKSLKEEYISFSNEFEKNKIKNNTLISYINENKDILNASFLDKQVKELTIKKDNLLLEYENIKDIIDLEKKIIELKLELNSLSDLFYFKEFGLYENDINLSKYTSQGIINKIKENQKEILKSDNYYYIMDDYSVNNSVSKGRKMQKDNAKIGIRCFNEESKNIIKNATPQNKNVRKKRLDKSFELINNTLGSVGVAIVRDILDVKKELLNVEVAKYVRKEKEKELLREKKEEERERKIVEREIKRELDKIAKEEEHVRNELARLKKEKMLEGKYREQIDKLNQQLLDLENQKEKVNENVFKGRAGYVYIIGNKGAFGEGVYKIGVTRRLDPFDRINELSSASVPFKFETHATIFSEDAFSLEKQLHNTFDSFKVNKVNNHKEFFKVPLEDIREEVLSIDNSVEFDMNEINYEYLQTLKIEEQLKTNTI